MIIKYKISFHVCVSFNRKTSTDITSSHFLPLSKLNYMFNNLGLLNDNLTQYNKITWAPDKIQFPLYIHVCIGLNRTTSFDVGPMKSLTLDVVSSVANSIPVNPNDLRGRLQIFWPVSRMRKFSHAWVENLPHYQIMDRFPFYRHYAMF